MEQWAILSGIEGNLVAYEAVLADIRQHPDVSDLYILGDVVGLRGDNETVIRRLRSPRRGELKPQVCIGWWEEQCFSLHGLSGSPDAPELMAQWGGEGIKRLWETVSRESVGWLQSLHFGFHELDCLLIHGSTVSYADELTPMTHPVILYDRLLRADAHTLLCGRSGLAFDCQIDPSPLCSIVTTLDDSQAPQEQAKTRRRIIGVGSVGHQPGQSSYVLYHPASNDVTFKTVHYSAS